MVNKSSSYRNCHPLSPPIQGDFDAIHDFPSLLDPELNVEVSSRSKVSMTDAIIWLCAGFDPLPLPLRSPVPANPQLDDIRTEFHPASGKSPEIAPLKNMVKPISLNMNILLIGHHGLLFKLDLISKLPN